METNEKTLTIVTSKGQGGIEIVSRRNYKSDILYVNETTLTGLLGSQYGIIFKLKKIFINIKKYENIVTNLPFHHIIVSLICLLLKKKHLSVEHGPWSIVLFENSRLTKLAYEYWLRNTKSKVICVSLDLFALYRLYNVKKLYYIPNSIPLTKNLEKTFNGTIKIIFAGRMHFQKDPELAIKSFLVFNNKNPNSELDFYGSGELLESLVNKYSNYHSIKFHNHVPNICQIFHEYDILLITSKFEGLPGVILEAINSNIKVVSVPFISGLLELNRFDNLYISRNLSPSDIASTIQESMDNNYNFDFKSYYSVNSVSTRYEKVINS